MLIAVLHRRHELREHASAPVPVIGSRTCNAKGSSSKNDKAPPLGIIYHLKVACFCPAFSVTCDQLGINFLMQRPLDPFSYNAVASPKARKSCFPHIAYTSGLYAQVFLVFLGVCVNRHQLPQFIIRRGCFNRFLSDLKGIDNIVISKRDTLTLLQATCNVT